LIGIKALPPGGEAFVRVTLSQPTVVDFKDPFVLREAGRRETVAGGVVLDPAPPARPGEGASDRLRGRLEAGSREELARRVVADRGAVRAHEVLVQTGVSPDGAVARGAIRSEGWLLEPRLAVELAARFTVALGDHHRAHPLLPGLEMGEARSLLAEIEPMLSDPGLADALLAHLADTGAISRQGGIVKLPDHSPSTAGREDADRLVEAVRSSEPVPPTVKDLLASGFGQELIKATCGEGRLIRISPDVVFSPAFVARAETIVRERASPPGITVSAFREALGTSRKFALPLLEYFDARGLTRRQGDYRVLREGRG
jgi:selenocysteine-specific elongation factor